MLLRLSHIARFYGPRLVFKDVSLEVAEGTITLLAGSNGAGKSTLMKIMAGLLRPSSGSVDWGKDGEPPAIGYLGHQTFIYPDLTALENLHFWAAMHGRKLRERELDDILQRVELAAFAEEKAKAFSRGMAQRLNLARVFMLRPSLLLLDEPGTGLDTRSTAILHREVRAAKEAGAGIVWITHSLEDDLQRADMAAILDGGKLAFFGSAAQCRAWMHAQQPGQEQAPAVETPLEARGGLPC